ncbi:MAG: STAS domain-containing protein [Planctomycetota bacterium]
MPPMQPQALNATSEVLRKYEKQLLADWLRDLTSSLGDKGKLVGDDELRAQAQELLRLLRETTQRGDFDAALADQKGAIQQFLAELSRQRVMQGFTSDQTATFVFSLKRPLFARLRQELGNSAEALADAMWSATQVLDSLGLATVREYQRSREDVIARQQQELLELSTPVVKLWEGVLALPMIGTLDSSRTQIVMESLLQRIVETGSEIAIIDITGVPTVDTLVAQHLLKTVTAIRLMGADCIISGVRPQIAQTIVHLGVDLAGVTTKATLADALTLALKRSGFIVSRKA